MSDPMSQSIRAFALCGLALLASACAHETDCGPGTQRKQLANGEPARVPVDVAHGETVCDADGGVQLVAGNQCVSVLQCGPGTVLDTSSNQCRPAARAPHEPDACPTPSSGHICVNGTLRNLVDGSFLSNQTVTVALYDPQSLLGGGNAAPLVTAQASDTFMFPDVVAPSLGYILVATDNPTGETMYARLGVGGVTQSGQSVRVDGYLLTRATLSAWSTAAGTDYAASGALVYRMFNDPPPPTSARTPTETHPVAGAQLIDGATSAPPAGVRYFGTTLDTIDPKLTVTSTSGGAIVSSSGLATYTARGGGVTTWEAHQALLVAGLVQLDSLHPQP
jgi:hypothetical protein